MVCGYIATCKGSLVVATTNLYNCLFFL